MASKNKAREVMNFDPGGEDDPPVVIFAFNRPQKLRRVLNALRYQNVHTLIFFVDGARNASDLPKVEACRRLAEGVNWANAELHFSETNYGLAGLANCITQVFEQHSQAIFLEDDCLPAPGFMEFMRRALEKYAQMKTIFSIGAYQPLKANQLPDPRAALIVSARFNCWGWATWKERWFETLPYLAQYHRLFDHLRYVPWIAGDDLPWAARWMARGDMPLSWDIQVAITCLYLRKFHLIVSRGLVRNIGLTGGGSHSGRLVGLRNAIIHNKNVVRRMPDGLIWPQQATLDCEYMLRLRGMISRVREWSPRRQFQRIAMGLRRRLAAQPERYFALDLLDEPHPPFERRALFSYLTHPFSIPPDDPRSLRHINVWHARQIVRALNAMGYLVDVIDYRDLGFIPCKDYDLFIGHGGINFVAIAAQLLAKTRKIYFSTGAYWVFHNQEEKKRFELLRLRRGVDLPADRPIVHPEEEALQLADGILGIGNEFTRQTYASYSNVEMIPGTALYDDFPEWHVKDDTIARSNFLFYASRGNVHKGLDLLIEAFTNLEQQHLWIMAPIEAAFRHLYETELYHRSNIHTLGWVQPRSPTFYRLMSRCSWCILPSCSEGQSQSVVDAMNQGLIPIVSLASGVDVEGFGYWIEPVTIENIRSLVIQAFSLPEDEIARRAKAARQTAQNIYGEARFIPNFQQAFHRLLGVAQGDQPGA